MITLKTDRLILRPLSRDDAPLISKFAGEWDVARMTERIPYPYRADVAFGWVESLEKDLVFALEYDTDFVGCCGIAEKPNTDETELGYWIARPWWGQGFATEAGKAVVSYAFATLAAQKLVSGHFEDNPASARVLKKIGFLPTGEACPRYCQARNEDVICVGFELLKERAVERGLIS